MFLVIKSILSCRYSSSSPSYILLSIFLFKNRTPEALYFVEFSYISTLIIGFPNAFCLYHFPFLSLDETKDHYNLLIFVWNHYICIDEILRKKIDVSQFSLMYSVEEFLSNLLKRLLQSLVFIKYPIANFIYQVSRKLWLLQSKFIYHLILLFTYFFDTSFCLRTHSFHVSSLQNRRWGSISDN